MAAASWLSQGWKCWCGFYDFQGLAVLVSFVLFKLQAKICVFEELFFLKNGLLKHWLAHLQ